MEMIQIYMKRLLLILLNIMKKIFIMIVVVLKI